MRPRDFRAAQYWARYFAAMDELKREEAEILRRHRREMLALVMWSFVATVALLAGVYVLAKFAGVS